MSVSPLLNSCKSTYLVNSISLMALMERRSFVIRLYKYYNDTLQMNMTCFFVFLSINKHNFKYYKHYTHSHWRMQSPPPSRDLKPDFWMRHFAVIFVQRVSKYCPEMHKFSLNCPYIFNFLTIFIFPPKFS